MKGVILPVFQKFLVSHHLVPEKNSQYYAYWVSKFLVFANKNIDLSCNTKIEKFLKYLEGSEKTADWQIKQAETALRLYIDHFLGGDTKTLETHEYLDIQHKHYNLSYVIRKMREIIQIKHYSYRTERSYIDWVKRFYIRVSVSVSGTLYSGITN